MKGGPGGPPLFRSRVYHRTQRTPRDRAGALRAPAPGSAAHGKGARRRPSPFFPLFTSPGPLAGGHALVKPGGNDRPPL